MTPPKLCYIQPRCSITVPCSPPHTRFSHYLPPELVRLPCLLTPLDNPPLDYLNLPLMHLLNPLEFLGDVAEAILIAMMPSIRDQDPFGLTQTSSVVFGVREMYNGVQPRMLIAIDVQEAGGLMGEFPVLVYAGGIGKVELAA